MSKDVIEKIKQNIEIDKQRKELTESYEKEVKKYNDEMKILNSKRYIDDSILIYLNDNNIYDLFSLERIPWIYAKDINLDDSIIINQKTDCITKYHINTLLPSLRKLAKLYFLNGNASMDEFLEYIEILSYNVFKHTFNRLETIVINILNEPYLSEMDKKEKIDDLYSSTKRMLEIGLSLGTIEDYQARLQSRITIESLRKKRDEEKSVDINISNSKEQSNTYRKRYKIKGRKIGKEQQ